MRRSRSPGFTCCALLLAACGGGDAEVADTMLADSTAMPAPAGVTLSLADMAGRWNMRAVPETGDTTPTLFVLTATADTSGWSITFPDRAPEPTRVLAVGGDSLVLETGPYESARRAGVRTTTTTTLRMMGDSVAGTSVARYQTTGADSVLRLRSSGTRAP